MKKSTKILTILAMIGAVLGVIYGIFRFSKYLDEELSDEFFDFGEE